MNVKQILLLAASVVAFTGCGGGSGSGSTAPTPKQLEISEASLRVASADELGARIRNGVYGQHFVLREMADTAPEEALAPPAPELGEHSQTNTQEAGIDEVDRVEYDGNVMYLVADSWNDPIASRSSPVDTQSYQYVRVLQRQENNQLQQVSRIDVAGESRIDGLYLRDGRLVLLTSAYHYHCCAMDWRVPYGWQDQTVGVTIYDVNDPAQPELMATYSIDGALVDSRRIDDRIYLVSRYHPQLPGLINFAVSEQDKLNNFDLLEQTATEDLLPKLKVGDAEPKALFDAGSCLIPADSDEDAAEASLINVLTLDLARDDPIIDSQCINSTAHGIYLSSRSLYLYGSEYFFTSWDTPGDEKTVIHKFALEQDQVRYAATGAVAGSPRWQNASYRFSEHRGLLRVVTSRFDPEWQPIHQLSILAENGATQQLELLSQLPNASQPTPIGKPGEDIYGVRYFGDRAYIVTFERIDPLYVLDLADGEAPYIAGELELPGYSAYLHPVNEDLLIGVGQQIDPNRLPQPWIDQPQQDALVEGAKISLFDVSQLDAPQQLAEQVFANGFTLVEWDPHAFTSLKMQDDTLRIAVPVSSWQEQDQGWHYGSSLKLMQVDPIAGSLDMQGALFPENDTDLHGWNGWNDRSVLHGDQIYYLHGNQVWHSEWSAPEQVLGIY